MPRIALERLENNLHLLAQLQVECAERLVQQQHARRPAVDDRAAARSGDPPAAPWPPESWIGFAIRRNPFQSPPSKAPPIRGGAALGRGRVPLDPQPVAHVSRSTSHVWEERVGPGRRCSRPRAAYGGLVRNVGRLRGLIVPASGRSKTGDHPQRSSSCPIRTAPSSVEECACTGRGESTKSSTCRPTSIVGFLRARAGRHLDRRRRKATLVCNGVLQ